MEDRLKDRTYRKTRKKM